MVNYTGGKPLPPSAMGLLPDAQNCGLRMCRECFPRHRFQRKPLISDTGMHHGTCVKHVPWCMSGSLTNGGGENVPGIPGVCAARNFAYLVRGPWQPDALMLATICMWHWSRCRILVPSYGGTMVFVWAWELVHMVRLVMLPSWTRWSFFKLHWIMKSPKMLKEAEGLARCIYPQWCKH